MPSTEVSPLRPDFPSEETYEYAVALKAATKPGRLELFKADVGCSSMGLARARLQFLIKTYGDVKLKQRQKISQVSTL